MDFLDSVMELLNSTPPPLRNSSNDMEPNNLSQTQDSTEITAAAIAEAVAAAPARPAAAAAFAERNLELKLPPILSSSSSDSESEEATNATGTAGTSAVGDGERAASPPPNCAICLGRCKNKCFTDSCMHQFCFKCLCEWSKVKPECPLCKQTFKSIIHNVKSEDQFEEYHVQPPTVQLTHPPFEMDFQEMRIFGVVHSGHNRNAWNDATHRPFFYGDFSTASPYSSSASTGGAGGAGSTGSVAIPAASGSSSNNRSFAQSIRGSRNQYVYRGELLDMYRQEYPGAIANSGTLSQLWRRYVYDRKLYAMPVADITGRFRESSARFYRDNPSQIHRLMPWINRDIVCLLRQTQHDVTSVLESIYSALTLMNILSPAFRRRVQPFLGTKTAHFIHELNNFARSPYDMIGYDRAVQYSPQTNSEEIVIEFTSSDESTDNEQIDVAGDSGAAGGVGSSSSNNNTSSSSSRSRSATNNASSINAINLTIHNRLTSGLMNAAGSRLAGIIGANNGSGGGGGVGGLSDLQDDVSLVIDLRGESDNNETTSTAQATTNSSNYQNGQNTGTSEGGDIIMSVPPPTVSENIELTSGSSDECEFILERKPPHLRTPEMVSLDSASDSDVVFVEESKPLNKTSFSSSEGEPDDCPASLPKHHTRHNNKIAALVEAKKRNHSANLVKSEQQDSQTEIYNLGASTSAALRLSLQKRVDKSHRSGSGGSSSSRLRREKYSLRNSETRVERPTPKRRGKRLDSESSHSSTSSSSTTISSSSSSTTTSSSNSSSSSSDEDYIASTSQRRKEGVAAGTRKRSKVRKTKKRKASTSSNRRTATATTTSKRDSRKRKKPNNEYFSGSDDEDDDNGHIGKNFALVMAINECQKRQNRKQKNVPKAQEPKEEDSDQDDDAENSWRLMAVNEPLRKQQQQRVKTTHKSAERKRRHKTSAQQQQQKQRNDSDNGKGHNERKRQKFETERPTTTDPNYNSDDTSSDESDNINLIQLKTKLTGQDQPKEMDADERDENKNTEMANESETTITNNEINEQAIAEEISEFSNILTSISAVGTTDSIVDTPANAAIYEATSGATGTETTTTHMAQLEATQEPNELLHFFDESNDNEHNDNDQNHIEAGQRPDDDQEHDHDHDSNSTYHNEQQILPSTSSLENYHNDETQNNVENNKDLRNNEDPDDDDDDEDETLSNIPTNMNLNETNVFADGTSMSTTTTDTILHEAAEQISSAAVNFYNPQQTFNTADFADENSTNSSSSDSSISSTTTSLSSSSNSSSSNTNTSYLNYDH